MDRTLKIMKIPMLVLACCAATAANAADIVEFTAGTAAKAEEVNSNFDFVIDKIDSLNAVSGSRDREGVADCAADANALRDMVDKGVNKISFSGDCNGPLFPTVWTRLTGIGKDTSSISGFKDADNTYDTVVWNRSSFVEIQDTTIKAGMLNTDTVLVGSEYGSEVRLKNVDVIGPNNPTDNSNCLFARQGSFRLTDVKISACNEAIGLTYSSFAEIREDTQGATVIENNRDWWTVSVSHGSSLRVKGGTFKGNLKTDPDDTDEAIGVQYNSTIRMEGGKVEGLGIKRNSSAQLKGGEVIDILRVQKRSYASLEKAFVMSKSGTAGVDPIIKVYSSELDTNKLATQLDLSKLKARSGSKISIEGTSIANSMTVDDLNLRQASLSLYNQTVTSLAAQVSSGDFELENSELNISGVFVMWGSNGWLGDGSTIRSGSYEGDDANECPRNIYRIGHDDTSSNSITYPVCP